MKVTVTPEQIGLNTDPIIRGIATIRMFVAAHNMVLPGDRITGDELELLDDTANGMEEFLTAYKKFVTAEERRKT